METKAIVKQNNNDNLIKQNQFYKNFRWEFFNDLIEFVENLKVDKKTTRQWQLTEIIFEFKDFLKEKNNQEHTTDRKVFVKNFLNDLYVLKVYAAFERKNKINDHIIIEKDHQNWDKFPAFNAIGTMRNFLNHPFEIKKLQLEKMNNKKMIAKTYTEDHQVCKSSNHKEMIYISVANVYCFGEPILANLFRSTAASKNYFNDNDIIVEFKINNYCDYHCPKEIVLLFNLSYILSEYIKEIKKIIKNK